MDFDFIDRAVKSLSPRRYGVIMGRFFHETPIPQLAREFDLTTEKYHLLEAAIIDELAEFCGTPARTHTKRLRDELANNRGLLHIHRAQALTHEQHFGKILLATHIAGQNNAYWWQEDFLLTITPTGRDELFQEFNQALIDLNELQVDLEDVVAAAQEVGLTLTPAATEQLLYLAFELQLRNGCFISPWDTTATATPSKIDPELTNQLDLLLAAHDGPTTLRQLCQDLPDFSHARHIISRHLIDAPFTLFLERRRYLHQNATGLSPQNTKTLLQKLRALLPPDGTPIAAPKALDLFTTKVTDPRILWALAKNTPDLIAGPGLLIAHRTANSIRTFFHLAILDAIDDLGLARTHEIHTWLYEHLAFTSSPAAIQTTLTELEADTHVYKLSNDAYVLTTDDPTELIDYFTERPQLLRQALPDLEPKSLPTTLFRALIDFYTHHEPEPRLVDDLNRLRQPAL